MYRRNYRYYPHIPSKREKISEIVAGIDDEIIQRLFNFQHATLDKFFEYYGYEFGENAERYARKAFNDWKTRRKKPIGNTIERMINLVPHFLSDAERYDLLKILYEKKRYREFHSIEILLGQSTEELSKLESIFNHLCHKPDMQDLPPETQRTISWVCNNNSILARKIMATIEKEQSALIVNFARIELKQLYESIQELQDSVVGIHEIKLPHGTITITIKKPSLFQKIAKQFK